MIRDKVSTLLLFGATGDLAHRMLLPSLYGLHSDGLLPDDFRILCTARRELVEEQYRACAVEALHDRLVAERLRSVQVLPCGSTGPPTGPVAVRPCVGLSSCCVPLTPIRRRRCARVAGRSPAGPRCITKAS